MQPKRASLPRTLASGFVAGLAGAWAMARFMRVWHKVLPEHVSQPSRPRLPYSQQEWDATRELAKAAAFQAFGRRLSTRETQTGAVFFHYAVGGAAGALYAAVADRSPGIRKFSGMLFGASLWLLADELLMPATGISRKLKNYSLLEQANALGEHIAYGVTTDTLLRLL